MSSLGEASGRAEESGRPFIDRDLSWLAFNKRVLHLAADPQVPLLERLKFCAIFSNNLDEFFQIRVAGWINRASKKSYGPLMGASVAGDHSVAIANEVQQLLAFQSKIYLEELLPGLAEAGISIVSFADVDPSVQQWLGDVFQDRIFPVLTPLAVDPGHPFPYISTLSLNLAITVRDPITGERRFARVKVPPLLPRFVVCPDGKTFVPLEDLIAAKLDALFPGMVIEQYHPFRVTRDADLTLEEEEADDLLSAVESELARRKFGRAVRLEVGKGVDGETLELLHRELELGLDHTYLLEGILDFTGLFAVCQIDRPDLKDEPWHGVEPYELSSVPDEGPVDIFGVLRERDLLVQHPYDSFAATVERFIEQAAADPHVLAIKQTLYRTFGDSAIVKALIRAAESGKQVAALVELKARFDEQANITWARALERAGVHVVYGLVGLKTHSKTSLVVRAEHDGLRRYVHIGTGNYHPATARLYEDIGILTADKDISTDVADLFNALTGYARQVSYRKLLVAPTGMRERILERIEGEIAHANEGGKICWKLNSLVDPYIIDALYKASQAGVQVQLLVRGICCLVPGVPGVSENITVRSIVGRFLEHSRVYSFGDGVQRPTAWFIGSADMMPRNLDRRIEVLVPIEDELLRVRLADKFAFYFADTELSWELHSDHSWTRNRSEERPEGERVNAQMHMQMRALERKAKSGRWGLVDE